MSIASAITAGVVFEENKEISSETNWINEHLEPYLASLEYIQSDVHGDTEVNDLYHDVIFEDEDGFVEVKSVPIAPTQDKEHHVVYKEIDAELVAFLKDNFRYNITYFINGYRVKNETVADYLNTFGSPNFDDETAPYYDIMYMIPSKN